MKALSILLLASAAITTSDPPVPPQRYTVSVCWGCGDTVLPEWLESTGDVETIFIPFASTVTLPDPVRFK